MPMSKGSVPWRQEADGVSQATGGQGKNSVQTRAEGEAMNLGFGNDRRQGKVSPGGPIAG